MKKVIFAIFLALLFCGQIKAQEVEGVTSEYIPSEGKYKYNFPLPEVPEWPDPIVSGEYIDWAMESINNAENGLYHFGVKSFNAPILFYWNNRKLKANKYLNPSFPGFDPSTGCVKYYLKDGKAYVSPQERKLPGESGDHLVRWTDNKDGTITLYCNNADIGNDVSDPYVSHSALSPDKWWEKITSQSFFDASGFGKISVIIKDNTYFEDGKKYLIFSYGAYKNDGTIGYPVTFYNSLYLNEEKTGFKIPLP